VTGEKRKVLLELIDEAKALGVSQKRICWALGVNDRRVQRWRRHFREHGYERKPTVKTHRPYNALTPQERQVVTDLTASREHADDSCRTLSTKALDKFGMYISHVAFWRHQVALGINGPRGVYARRRSKHSKPDVDATAPNQLWTWDITHLKTYEKYRFFYLYAILDSFSRKVVGWHVSDLLNSDEALITWDKALVAEGFHEGKEMRMPSSLSDRGSQMRSYSVGLFFKTLGITTHFARPRTPNDNPQIESLFSTVKCAPAYPERFRTVDEAQKYFDEFFRWYNVEHYHTRLGMIRPADVHSGRADLIRKERARIRARTMEARRRFNCRAA